MSIDPKIQIRSRVRGYWFFMPSRMGSYYSKHQKRDKIMTGRNLRVELEGQPVMGVQLLEHLVLLFKIDKSQIPRWFDGKTIFFWGTIYCSWGDENQQYVEYLYFNFEANEYYRGYRYLDHPEGFDKDCPAVISVPPKYTNLPEEEVDESHKEEPSYDDGYML
ncbi:MAG: hypothetical protein Q7S19_01140 [bacterium]|nr:hypothetical protein [bacterium]